MKLGLVCIALLACGVCATNTVSNDVNWTLVPASQPQEVSLNNPDLGQCLCDVTSFACDPLCCCDADCSAIEISQFSECYAEKLSSSQIEYCNDRDKGTVTNVEYLNNDKLDRVTIGGDLVCLVTNNYPSGAASFFDVPSSVVDPSVSVLTANEWFVKTSASSLVVGSILPWLELSFAGSTPRLVESDGGVLAIPLPGEDGTCSTFATTAYTFLTPRMSSSCTVHSSMCTQLSSTRWDFHALGIAGSSFTSTGVLPITVSVVNQTDGSIIAQSDPATAFRDYFAGNATNQNSALPESQLVSGVCLNGVVRRDVTIVYESSASSLFVVKSAKVTLYIANISSSSVLSSTIVTVRSESTQSSTSFSGRPGFTTGSYIPSGNIISDPSGSGKRAVQERQGGFAIPSGGSSCFSNIYRPVAFLHDVYNSGCYVTITEGDLESLCSNGTGTTDILRRVLSQSSSLTSAFANETGDIIRYIAKTADADISTLSSWVAIDGLDVLTTTSVSTVTYDTVRRQCSNLMVGLAYTFVVARAGAETNPQDVIVGAFVKPITGSWRIRSDDKSTSATANVPFRFRVRFVRYQSNEQATISRRIVAPPILPDVDDTIFYPFRR